MFGRVLEICVWDQFKFGKGEIGFGVLDLDPLVRINMEKLKNNQNSTPNPNPNMNTIVPAKEH